MSDSVHSISVLPAEQRPFITDIYIPYTQQGGTTAAFPDDAVCYIGQAQPFKLFDENSRDQFSWFTKIWSASEQTIVSGDDYRIYHDNGYFRAHRMHTAEGYKLALRAIPSRTPAIEELIKPALWEQLLLDPDLLYGGLIMFCGTNGVGKTTLASATTVSRLKAFGGHANTAEDPIEYPMEGVHIGKAKGICYQHAVTPADRIEPGKSIYAQSLSKALRAFPAITGGGTILMVGEVRDPETAAELLLAASNGHLVITTFHGHTLPSAMARFLSMASQYLRGTERELFAASLRLATHQKLRFDNNATPNEAEPWKRGKFEGTMIWNDRSENSSIQSSLRDAPSIVEAVHVIAQHQQKLAVTAGMTLNEFKKQAGMMPAIKAKTP